MGETRRPRREHDHVGSHRRLGATLIRLPRGPVAVGLLLVGFGASGPGAFAQEILVPDPPTAGMEAAVAEAIAEARRRVEAEPGAAAAWGALGRTFHAHGLEEEAAASYERAEALAPADFRWPYLLGAALKHIRPGEALAAARRAAGRDPTYAPAHLLAAELLERAGDASGAMAAWRAALAAAPETPLAELGLGRLLLGAGDPEAASQHLTRAAGLAPRARPVQVALARLHRLRGDGARAREVSEAAAALPAAVPVEDPLLLEVWDAAVSAWGVEQRALRAEQAGDLEAAEMLYERLVEQRPGAANLLFNFGNLLLRARRLESAVGRYQEALEADPDHVPARVNLGGALLLLGRRDEAVAQLEAALERDPDDVDSHRTLGGLFAYRGDHERAIRHFRSALAGDPGQGEVHRDLAIVLAAEGRFEAAWEHVGRAEALGAPPSRAFLLELQAAHPRR